MGSIVILFGILAFLVVCVAFWNEIMLLRIRVDYLETVVNAPMVLYGQGEPLTGQQIYDSYGPLFSDGPDAEDEILRQSEERIDDDTTTGGSTRGEPAT